MTRILASALLIIAIVVTAMPDTWAIVSDKIQAKSGKHQDITKKQKNKKQIGTAEIEKQSSEDTKRLNKVIDSAQSYKDSPSNETYTELWQNFESWVHQLAIRHIDASNSCKAYQALSKAGLKIIDATGSGGSIRIYTFSPQAIWAQNKTGQPAPSANLKSDIKPLVSPMTKTPIETRDILVQSLESVQAEPNSRLSKRHSTKRARTIRVKKTALIRTQSINIPSGADIKQVCLLSGSTGAKTVFLAINGVDLQSGHSWLEGLKHTGTGWVFDNDLWQQVPSFLLQTGQAKVRLSENSLVITIGSRGAADNTGSTTGYELVMPFIENHFALARNAAQDPARAVALQFLLAIQGKRADLAKIWLADPQLASIPGYLGLYNRSGSTALKLISMPPPLNGGARFRLITNTKDDLIVYVGKVKTQWLVKGLFIAPADALSTQIGRLMSPE